MFVAEAAAGPRLFLVAEKPYVRRSGTARVTVYVINEGNRTVTLPTLESVSISVVQGGGRDGLPKAQSSVVAFDHFTPHMTLGPGQVVHRDLDAPIGAKVGDSVVLSAGLAKLKSNELILIRQ